MAGKRLRSGYKSSLIIVIVVLGLLIKDHPTYNACKLGHHIGASSMFMFTQRYLPIML